MRLHFAVALLALATFTIGFAQTQPTRIDIPDGPIPVRILEQGPADTDAELQIICLFSSDPANTLHGSLIEMNEKLKGLLDRIRQPGLFRGDLGETILISPAPGTIPAKKLLIIGLGDSQTFSPKRMELIGSIAYREASRLGAAHPFFAPTILDGGVTKFTTGETAERVIHGFLRAAATEKALKEAGDSAGVGIEDLTYLAGPKYASSTKDGILKSFAASK